MTEDWRWQYRMMDAMMVGLERSLASFAWVLYPGCWGVVLQSFRSLWNYNPDNNDIEGDNWNGENFSWFSRRRALPPSLLDLHQTSFTLDNGSRILSAVVRPYPAKTAGIPISFEYEMNIGRFIFEWKVSDTTSKDTTKAKARETEIFVPSLLTHGRKLKVEGLEPGDSYIHDEARQTLFIVHGASGTEEVRKVAVSVWPPLRPTFSVNTFWGDFGELIMSGLVVFIGVFIFIKVHFYM